MQLNMRQLLVAGLKFLLPLLFVVILLRWLYLFVDGMLEPLVTAFIGQSYYITGMGVVAALLLAIFIGLIIQQPKISAILEGGKSKLLSLPLIDTLYKVSSDIIAFVTKKGMKQGTIVRVETPLGSVIGIMTREDFRELPDGVGSEEEVAVYIPMSYQIGGYSLIVAREKVSEVDISVREGLALTMTAYISGRKKNDLS